MSLDLIDAGLMAERPKEYDIFRIYRENHPETLAFKPPETESQKEIDFTPKPGMLDHLRAAKMTDTQAATVELLLGEAATSAAAQQIHKIADVNAALADGNVAGAEWRMGREITDDEIAAKRVTKGRTLIGAQSAREKVMEEARKDILKEKIKAELEKQERMRKFYHGLSKKREKLRGKEAAHAHAMQQRFLQLFAQMPEFGVREDDDEEELLQLGQQLADQSQVMRDALEILSRAATPPGGADVMSPVEPNLPLPDGDDDLESIAPTEYAPTEIGERTVLGPQPPGAPKKPPRPDNVRIAIEEPDMARARPAIDLDELEERKGPEPTLKDPDESIQVGALDPNYTYTGAQLKQRANELRTKYPSLKARGNVLASVSIPAAQLRTAIEKAEKMEREGKLKEGEGLKLKARSDAPRRTGDYAPFGPRFFISMPKLRAGEFSLCHPSGQKPNLIRNSKLTPALKQVVMNFLDGAPQDTSDLTDDEMKWYKAIWEECRLSNRPKLVPIKPKRYPTVKGAKERVKVLVGEIMAGNDSPLLVKELDELTSAMGMRGWLSQPELAKLREFL